MCYFISIIIYSYIMLLYMNNNLEYMKIYNFPEKKRLGINSDGGYVIGILEGKYDCYISAGVSNEESFSRDFIEMYNMNKYNCAAFDGTIDNYPHHYTEKITFYKSLGYLHSKSLADKLVGNHYKKLISDD